MTTEKNRENALEKSVGDSYTKENSFLKTLSQIFSISDSIYSSCYNPKNKKHSPSSSAQNNYSYNFYSLFV